MNCPYCHKDVLKALSETIIICAASDGSYGTADAVCPHCKEEIQLYYPLTEIN